MNAFLLKEARRWVEQERTWDPSLYASTESQSDMRSVQPPTTVTTPPTLKASAVSVQGAVSSSTLPLPTTTPIPSPQPPQGDSQKATQLAALYEKYKDCVRCRLGTTRIKIVFGVGSPDSRVLFIGEGPGYEEDRRGEPFVGKAGQLLDKILSSIGLSRQTNAYIANIVKCHPMSNPETPDARGNDRPPAPDEVETCSPILLQQIAILQPVCIVTLGSPSTRMILRTKDGITGLRGRFFPFAVDDFYPRIAPPEQALADDVRERLRAIQVLPTYHPAALLRNPNLKGDTWTDMKLLRDTLAQ